MVGTYDVSVDLGFQGHVVYGSHWDVSRNLQSGLNSQSSNKDDQGRKDYDVDDNGLKRIPFSPTTCTELVGLADCSVNDVFLWRCKKLNGLFVSDRKRCRAHISQHRFCKLFRLRYEQGWDYEQSESGCPKGKYYNWLFNSFCIVGQGTRKSWVV